MKSCVTLRLLAATLPALLAFTFSRPVVAQATAYGEDLTRIGRSSRIRRNGARKKVGYDNGRPSCSSEIMVISSPQ